MFACDLLAVIHGPEFSIVNNKIVDTINNIQLS